jgi:hypothetical protein
VRKPLHNAALRLIARRIHRRRGTLVATMAAAAALGARGGVLGDVCPLAALALAYFGAAASAGAMDALLAAIARAALSTPAIARTRGRLGQAFARRWGRGAGMASGIGGGGRPSDRHRRQDNQADLQDSRTHRGYPFEKTFHNQTESQHRRETRREQTMRRQPRLQSPRRAPSPWQSATPSAQSDATLRRAGKTPQEEAAIDCRDVIGCGGKR